MIYLKLSFRNARRSFTNYLLYIITMIVLLAMAEVSNCIAIVGEAAGFQAISLPLLITVIQVVLSVYLDQFMLEERAREFASYLLMGMARRKLTHFFLWEVLLIGFGCYLAGTTTGFCVYGFVCFCTPVRNMYPYGALYGKSMFHTLMFFALSEAICMLWLKGRLGKLQIRELMYEKNRNQGGKNVGNYKKWGIMFWLSFLCVVSFAAAVVCLPETYIVYPVSIVVIPLFISVFAFYKWVFGCLYARRKMKSAGIYQKDRLYLIANMTSDFKAAVMINSVFCICFLFAAGSFITGSIMLQPELQIYDTAVQQWMGTCQIIICIVFLVIYFSILSLQQMINVRQNAKSNRIMCCMGKSNHQIGMLMKQQTAIKLIAPMIMALLIFLFCIPLINVRMNLILPAAMHNILFRLTGIFGVCILFFYLCYFGIVSIMSRRYREFPG